MKGLSALNDYRSSFTFIKNLQKLKNQNQNVLVLLLDELIDKNRDNIELNNLIDSISEFWEIDNWHVCIGSNLFDIILEQFTNVVNNIFFDENHSALFCPSYFNDSSWA